MNPELPISRNSLAFGLSVLCWAGLQLQHGLTVLVIADIVMADTLKKEMFAVPTNQGKYEERDSTAANICKS